MKKRKLLGLAAIAISSFGLMAGVNADAKEDFTNCLTTDEKETCKLTESISVDSLVNINRKVTIDLDGNTITLSSSAYLYLNAHEDIVISNGTITQTGNASAIIIAKAGKVTMRNLNVSNSKADENKKAAIQVGAKTVSGTLYAGSLVVEDGTVISGAYGISIFGSETNLEIKGGKIETNVFAITGNGTSEECNNSNITISGGTINSATSAAIYQPQSGSLNIEGGNISGAFGVVARQGTINITGGTITANKIAELEEDYVGDAEHKSVLFKTGTAIVVDNVANYGEEGSNAKVTVSGNTEINADVAVAYTRGTDGESNADKDIEIKGGKFNQTINSQYLSGDVQQSQSGVVGKVNTITKGNVSKGVIDVVANAAEGETVVVKVKAYAGYEVSNVTVKGATKGYDVTKNADGTYSFTMPGEEVTVSAEFVEKTPSKPAEDKNDVVVETPKGDENVTLSTEADEVLKDTLLNTEDEELKELLESNENVTIVLENEKITKEDLPKEELEKFEKAVEGATVTEFFELDIVVKVDGKDNHYLTELNKPITLTIDLPELPEVAKGYARKYYILREHEGVIEKLDATLTEDGKLSFATDKFSKYAIAYVDEEVKDSVADKNPSTIDNVMAYVSMAIASIGALGVTSKKFLKK